MFYHCFSKFLLSSQIIAFAYIDIKIFFSLIFFSFFTIPSLAILLECVVCFNCRPLHCLYLLFNAPYYMPQPPAAFIENVFHSSQLVQSWSLNPFEVAAVIWNVNACNSFVMNSIIPSHFEDKETIILCWVFLRQQSGLVTVLFCGRSSQTNTLAMRKNVLTLYTNRRSRSEDKDIASQAL